MAADRAQLRRLQRIERLRAIARRDAAQASAQAEGTLAQLARLSQRTRAMHDDYGTRTSMRDGLALLQHLSFMAGIGTIHRATSDDTAQAQAAADRLQQELAAAERRRAAVGQRLDAARRSLALHAQEHPLGPRRAIGTGLE